MTKAQLEAEQRQLREKIQERQKGTWKVSTGGRDWGFGTPSGSWRSA